MEQDVTKFLSYAMLLLIITFLAIRK